MFALRETAEIPSATPICQWPQGAVLGTVRIACNDWQPRVSVSRDLEAKPM
jgi:hypothetical protein